MRARRILIAFTVTAVLVLVGVVGVMHLLSTGGLKLPGLAPIRSEYCTATADGEVTLDLDQMANAATIVAVGIRRGVPDRAVTVALATALQESKLQNLNGGDRDSVGLFQQRPSQGWGTVAQISDPRYAAGKFYGALLRVHGWEKMTVTQAAQAVQRSGAPTAYQQWAAEAQVLSSALLGDESAAVACSVDDTPDSRGTAALAALAGFVHRDFGDLAHRVSTAEPDALALSVTDQRAGWQYAHWLVAHAQDSGIMSVRFGGMQWTAHDGVWQSASPSPTASAVDAAVASTRTVVAQVFGA